MVPSEAGGRSSDKTQGVRDGKNLRIMANLQYVLDLKRIHALVKFEFDGPQLRVYRCAPRLDVAPERIERLAGTFAQARIGFNGTRDKSLSNAHGVRQLESFRKLGRNAGRKRAPCPMRVGSVDSRRPE